jgi:hypothetical protein
VSDELIAGAHRGFDDAVHALIGRRAELVTRGDETSTVYLDSLYSELVEARHHGQRSDHSTGVSYKSKPPVWIDASSLLHQIDRTVASWWRPRPTQADLSVTVTRLHALVDYRWCPDDVAAVQRMTATIHGWVGTIHGLLGYAPAVKELKAACPVCGETYVTADSAGEQTRRYTLQLSTIGASCAACGETWAPEQYMALAALIGAATPDGMIQEAA